MERREPHKPDRNKRFSYGFQADHERKKAERQALELELQSNSWFRIGQRARKDPKSVFSNLLCHFTKENFRQAFRAIDGSKARGLDGVTKREYAERMEENLESLIERIHKGTYRPQPKRRGYIPKPNGDLRPIAISSFEDKLVEWVTAKTLSAIYEPHFDRNSFGFRSAKNAHLALEASYQSLKKGQRPYVVEMDIEKFFDTISHRRMILILQERITDRRLLSLISRFLQAGILEETGLINPERGTPQGSIMSPVLANLFLDHCLDGWFRTQMKGHNAVFIRYADDAVFFFERKDQAETFRLALKERMKLYGLKLNEKKSGLTDFGKKKGTIFDFLGFTFYWKTADRRSPRIALSIKTNARTIIKKIGEYTSWIKKMRSRVRIQILWKQTAAKLRGHYQYYGWVTNRNKLEHFYRSVVWNLFRWLNRRSQKRSMTWEAFQQRLQHFPLPTPPDVHALKPIDRWSIYANT